MNAVTARALPVLVALLLIVAAAALALSPTAPGRAGGTTYIVNSNLSEGDGSCDPSPGDCTLRDAILAANVQPTSRDVIMFDPVGFNPEAPLTISPGTPLPALTSSVGTVVDGTGAGVIIDGSLLAEGDGLLFHTSAGVSLQDVTVRSIEITNFPGDGIRVCAGKPDFPDACLDELLDTLIEGVKSTGNGSDGIFLNGGPNRGSTVRDSTASGNTGRGININGRTGTNLEDARVEGTIANNNGSSGINLNASNDTIAATVSGSTATGNDGAGININSGDANIGATVSGSTATGNDGAGININAGDANIGAAIIETTASNNGGSGIVVNASELSSNALVEDSIASENGSRGISINAADDVVDNAVVGSSAIDNGTFGIRINGTFGDNAGSAVLGSIASGNTDGAVVSTGGDLANATVAGGTFNGNDDDGIRMESKTAQGNVAQFNRIAGNGGAGINNQTGGPVEGSNNWWGCNEGPGEPGCDTTTGDVDGDPWLVLEISRLVPALIGVENPVDASVITNSDSEDTSADGHITDGTMIFFETDQGTIGSTTVERPTVAGIATALLVPDTPGTAIVSATLDNETVSIEIPVVPARDALWGDIDCNDSVSIGDALKIARYLLDLSVSQDLPCPEPASLLPVDGIARIWGDADCNDTIAIGDALKTARHLLGLSVSQEPGCPEIGSTVKIPE